MEEPRTGRGAGGAAPGDPAAPAKRELIPYRGEACATGYAFRALEGKWKLPTLFVLSVNGTLRYSELRRAPDITNVMLTNTLRDLEAFGLVTHVQYSEIPPHVEYSVSEVGMHLAPIPQALESWGADLMRANGLEPPATPEFPTPAPLAG